jgi:hypothetical protein
LVFANPARFPGAFPHRIAWLSLSMQSGALRPKSQTYVLVTAIDGAELTRAADQSSERRPTVAAEAASGAVP